MPILRTRTRIPRRTTRLPKLQLLPMRTRNRPQRNATINAAQRDKEGKMNTTEALVKILKDINSHDEEVILKIGNKKITIGKK